MGNKFILTVKNFQTRTDEIIHEESKRVRNEAYGWEKIIQLSTYVFNNSHNFKATEKL